MVAAGVVTNTAEVVGSDWDEVNSTEVELIVLLGVLPTVSVGVGYGDVSELN